MQSTQNGQTQYAPALACRGVRGATTVSANNAEQILSATSELLQTIMVYNEMEADDIASIYFTTSHDLTATFPAVAARQLGLLHTALLCGHEMQVPGSLEMCVRVLIHWNTTKTQKQVVNVYLNEAKRLRPDHELPTLRPKQIDPMSAMVKAIENGERKNGNG
jgi:chorismate mutase